MCWFALCQGRARDAGTWGTVHFGHTYPPCLCHIHTVPVTEWQCLCLCFKDFETLVLFFKVHNKPTIYLSLFWIPFLMLATVMLSGLGFLVKRNRTTTSVGRLAILCAGCIPTTCTVSPASPRPLFTPGNETEGMFVG